MEQKYVRENHFFKDLLAGYISGVANILSGQPFDICKVRIQSSGEGTFFSTLTNIIKQEGVLTLWKGSLFPLLGFGACNSILFAVNEKVKKEYRIKNNRQENTIAECYLAGGLAGFANSIISAPMEHIRIKMQTQKESTNKLYNGSIDAAQKIYRQHGVRGIFKGFLITFYREFFLYSSYFACYHWLKNKQENPGKGWMLMSGAIAGGAGWLGAFHLDNLKSRIQSDVFVNPKYPSLLKLPQQLGPKDLVKGFTPGFIRAFPVNAITFIVFEIACDIIYGDKH